MIGVKSSSPLRYSAESVEKEMYIPTAIFACLVAAMQLMAGRGVTLARLLGQQAGDRGVVIVVVVRRRAIHRGWMGCGTGALALELQQHRVGRWEYFIEYCVPVAPYVRSIRTVSLQKPSGPCCFLPFMLDMYF